MTAYVCRTALPDASAGGGGPGNAHPLAGGARRATGVRTTLPRRDRKRAGDLLDRDFTALTPNPDWATDFTYVRAWAVQDLADVEY